MTTDPLAVEIKQEMATSYFGACRKMVDALETLKEFDRVLATVKLDQAQLEKRNELLAIARERVFYLVIQREAMKLSTAEHFFEVYEIPDEVRMGMGPEQRKGNGEITPS